MSAEAESHIRAAYRVCAGLPAGNDQQSALLDDVRGHLIEALRSLRDWELATPVPGCLDCGETGYPYCEDHGPRRLRSVKETGG
ncbi:MAG TPA: hypothetical protein VJS45_05480 [Acidimicrobiia bacterium]|nr:hypothetical protein [Acidimicrobiia bacterium]